jgi:hypothetical protein
MRSTSPELCPNGQWSSRCSPSALPCRSRCARSSATPNGRFAAMSCSRACMSRRRSRRPGQRSMTRSRSRRRPNRLGIRPQPPQLPSGRTRLLPRPPRESLPRPPRESQPRTPRESQPRTPRLRQRGRPSRPWTSDRPGRPIRRSPRPTSPQPAHRLRTTRRPGKTSRQTRPTTTALKAAPSSHRPARRRFGRPRRQPPRLPRRRRCARHGRSSHPRLIAPTTTTRRFVNSPDRARAGVLLAAPRNGLG